MPNSNCSTSCHTSDRLRTCCSPEQRRSATVIPRSSAWNSAWFDPDTIITVAITPIAMTLLFVYVLGGTISAGGGKYGNYLLPGILLIAIASGIAYTARVGSA